MLLAIAKGLFRSLSPLVSFTCEEAWQALRRLGLVEEESVILSSWTDKDHPKDEALVAKWDWLFTLREGVNAAIEPHRKAGVIGQSLEARIDLSFLSRDVLERAGEVLTLPSGTDLCSLFIVSEVECRQGQPPEGAFTHESLPGVGIVFSRTTGTKCIRCWRYVKQVGTLPDHPEICDRCLEAVQPSG